MSKKSVLYIFIIICVLTSGFFLAGIYKSSIEMKNRGENIVPSVNGVEDITQPQFEFIINMDTDPTCTLDDSLKPYLCSGDPDYCCDAATYCSSLQGYFSDGVCYNDKAEYCSTIPATPHYDGTNCVCNGYNDNGTCVNECPLYHSGRDCVSSCPQYYTSDKECVSSCPNYHNSDGQCLDSCPSGLHDGNNQCVDSCPIYHDSNGQCVNSCPSGLHDSNNQCVDSCPIYHDSNGQCVNSCPSYHDSNNQCVSSCPRYYNSDGLCVDSCPVLRVGNECVDSCPTSSPFIANSVCYTASECRNQFGGQGYPDGNTCYSNQLAYCQSQGYDTVYDNKCYIKNSDSYCIAAKGTHYNGSGSCRTNAQECVALEGNGSVYRGGTDERYSPSKCDSPADQCSREGKVFVGGVCKTQQEYCEQVRKGTWKNGTCVSTNDGGSGVSGKTSNKDDKAKDDKVIGTDATLVDIVLSSGRLMFKPGITDYRVEVSSNVESISIEPVTTDPDATFVITGDYKLKPGDNPFTIVVTAEDGKATLTYNVVIVRTDRILSSNSSASLIEIANHEINFSKDQTEYEVDLGIDEDELDIKVTAEDNLSITEVFGNEGLQNGDIVTVKVTAEDGSYTVYAIKVNKEEPFNIKDYIPYIAAGVAGLLLVIAGAAVLRGRKSKDVEDEDLDEDNNKDNSDDKSKMRSKDE